MLAQEPWCFHPEQIARLTDWQIQHVYARPAAERPRRWGLPRDRTRGEPAPTSIDDDPAGPPEPNTPRFRDWVIAQFRKMGMSQDRAEAQYEAQAKQG